MPIDKLTTRNPLLIAVLLIVAAIVVAACSGGSQNAADGLKGWEKGSAYNALYNAADYDSFKGHIKKIYETVPMPGMAPGIAVEVAESKTETILVHLCPLAFAEIGDIGVKPGERVKVKGAWAEIDGKDVFMAAKIKKGDFFEFKVRLSSDGTPFWTMTAEELEKEISASQESLNK